MPKYEIVTEAGDFIDVVEAKTPKEAIQQIAYNAKMVFYLSEYSKRAGRTIYNVKLKAIKNDSTMQKPFGYTPKGR